MKEIQKNKFLVFLTRGPLMVQATDEDYRPSHAGLSTFFKKKSPALSLFKGPHLKKKYLKIKRGLHFRTFEDPQGGGKILIYPRTPYLSLSSITVMIILQEEPFQNFL